MKAVGGRRSRSTAACWQRHVGSGCEVVRERRCKKLPPRSAAATNTLGGGFAPVS